jgi:hypothetical protein
MSVKFGVRTYDDAAIAAALAKHGGHVMKAVDEIGCSHHVVYKYVARNGIKKPTGGKIQWKAGAYAQLQAMFDRSPRPSLQEMAAELNTTESSVQTALSRCGLTRMTHERRNATRRPCIICRTPFLSESISNRQCVSCFAESCEVAA